MANEMSSRERYMAAFRHEEADRVPIFIDTSPDEANLIRPTTLSGFDIGWITNGFDGSHLSYCFLVYGNLGELANF